MMLSLLRMKNLLRLLSLLKKNTRQILMKPIEMEAVRNSSQPLRKLNPREQRWKRRRKRKQKNSKQTTPKNKLLKQKLQTRQ